MVQVGFELLKPAHGDCMEEGKVCSEVVTMRREVFLAEGSEEGVGGSVECEGED